MALHKRANRIFAVPANGGAVEAAEDGIEIGAEFNQLDHAGEMRGGVHISDAAAAGDAREEGEFVAFRLILREVAIEVRRSDAPVVKAVAALVDGLAIDGRRVVVLLDKLDHHVAGEAHGERSVDVGGTATIFGVETCEMLEQEPGADFEFLDPVVDGFADVSYNVCGLDDAG